MMLLFLSLKVSSKNKYDYIHYMDHIMEIHVHLP